MTNHTDRAVRAAEELVEKGVYIASANGSLGWSEEQRQSHFVFTVEATAAIIDQETGLPEMQARIDRLEGETESWAKFAITVRSKVRRLEDEKTELVVNQDRLEGEIEKLVYTQKLQVEMEAGFISECNHLSSVNAELVEAHRAISSLHGNMSLDSIENVNGINDGRDRAIKLRAAIEISRAALAKAEPVERKE